MNEREFLGERMKTFQGINEGNGALGYFMNIR